MTDTRPYLEGALRAAAWIEAQRERSDGGNDWPGDPEDAGSVSSSLYSGTAGIVLFFLELFATTDDLSHLEAACRGGDSLLKRLSEESEVGLYSGLAGAGLALQRLAGFAADPQYENGAKFCAAELADRAEAAGNGTEWPVDMPDAGGRPAHGLRSMCTDVIAGSAGIGLWLLDAAEQWQDETLLELAASAGRRLIDCADETGNGLDWPMAQQLPYRMPNFSHGTAGVAYFLAGLALATGEKHFLDAATRGAAFLHSIAVTEGDICLVPHADKPEAVPGGDGTTRYALSWCHGPAGTGALWYRLYQATKNDEWLEWLARSARSFVPGCIPDSVSGTVTRVDPPGTWSSFCYCHGSAGNGEFLLNVHRVTGDVGFGEVAHRMIDDCLAQARHDQGGCYWPQNGARFDADGTMIPAVFPQTGFATGAAGIGYALLRFDAHAAGRAPVVTLPDWPFAEAW